MQIFECRGKSGIFAEVWSVIGVLRKMGLMYGLLDSSSTPKNSNSLSHNNLRERDWGVAPGAVDGGGVDWHAYGASICCTVGGNATSVAGE